MKLKERIERFYYKHFSEDEYGKDYTGLPHEDRMFHSMFSVIMLRLFIGAIALYFLSEVFFKESNYDTWQFLVAIFIGYLIAPIGVLFLPKSHVYVPKEKKKDFLKGSYLPFPLTIIWLMPKFL